MLFYTIGNQASITLFIDCLGISEPDEVVGGVLVGVLYDVIETPSRQAQ